MFKTQSARSHSIYFLPTNPFLLPAFLILLLYSTNINTYLYMPTTCYRYIVKFCNLKSVLIMPRRSLWSPVNCQNLSQFHLLSFNLLPWLNSPPITWITPKWSLHLFLSIPIPRYYLLKSQSAITVLFKKSLKRPSLPKEWLPNITHKVLHNLASTTFQPHLVQPRLCTFQSK